MQTVTVDAPDRCPRCGHKLDVRDAVTLERDPIDPTKAKAWHPDCWYKEHRPPQMGWTQNGFGPIY